MAHGVKGSRTPQCQIHTWLLHWQFIQTLKKPKSQTIKKQHLYTSVFPIQSVLTENTPGRCRVGICNHEKLKTSRRSTARSGARGANTARVYIPLQSMRTTLSVNLEELQKKKLAFEQN